VRAGDGLKKGFDWLIDYCTCVCGRAKFGTTGLPERAIKVGLWDQNAVCVVCVCMCVYMSVVCVVCVLCMYGVCVCVCVWCVMCVWCVCLCVCGVCMCVWCVYVCVQYLWIASFEARESNVLKTLDCFVYQYHIQLKFVYSQFAVCMQQTLATVLDDVYCQMRLPYTTERPIIRL
jgi:hypothetical protein